MIEYVLIGSIATLTLGLLLLRTNTAIVFLAICGGSVLLTATGTNASLVASSLSSGLDASTTVVRLLLLLVPVIVCAATLRNQLSKGLLPFALVPAVAATMLAILFIVPQLSAGLQADISKTDTWILLNQYQEPVIVIGLLTSIVLIVLSVKKPQDKHSRKGRH